MHKNQPEITVLMSIVKLQKLPNTYYLELVCFRFWMSAWLSSRSLFTSVNSMHKNQPEMTAPLIPKVKLQKLPNTCHLKTSTWFPRARMNVRHQPHRYNPRRCTPTTDEPIISILTMTVTEYVVPVSLSILARKHLVLAIQLLYPLAADLDVEENQAE